MSLDILIYAAVVWILSLFTLIVCLGFIETPFVVTKFNLSYVIDKFPRFTLKNNHPVITIMLLLSKKIKFTHMELFLVFS